MDTLIRRLNDAGVRYLVIGGQAVRLAGLPRFTMDWDLFIPGRDADNFARIEQALHPDLDLALEPVGNQGENLIQTYQTRWGVVQFHLAVPGLGAFEDVDSRAVVVVDEDGEPVRCVSMPDLLACKRAANRPQDQQDIAFLEERLRSSG